MIQPLFVLNNFHTNPNNTITLKHSNGVLDRCYISIVINKSCKERAFPEKSCTPSVEDIIFLKLTPLNFQSILWWPPRIFHFLALTALEIFFFSLKFRHTPWNSNYFHSTPWKFPLISSTGGFQIFYGKAQFVFKIYSALSTDLNSKEINNECISARSSWREPTIKKHREELHVTLQKGRSNVILTSFSKKRDIWLVEFQFKTSSLWSKDLLKKKTIIWGGGGGGKKKKKNFKILKKKIIYIFTKKEKYNYM